MAVHSRPHSPKRRAFDSTSVHSRPPRSTENGSQLGSQEGQGPVLNSSSLVQSDRGTAPSCRVESGADEQYLSVSPSASSTGGTTESVPCSTPPNQTGTYPTPPTPAKTRRAVNALTALGTCPYSACSMARHDDLGIVLRSYEPDRVRLSSAIWISASLQPFWSARSMKARLNSNTTSMLTSAPEGAAKA